MTLDLDGIRRLVIDRSPVREWPHCICEPYAEHALRVEARVAAAGGDDELRMVALLHRDTWLAKRRRSLTKAGVPRRVLELVDMLSYDRTVPVSEHARQIREAGLEIVCRADAEDHSAGRYPFLTVLVELDVTDPERRPDPADLLQKLTAPVKSFDFCYGVEAVCRMRVAEAVPHLARLYGQWADEVPAPVSQHVLDSWLSQIITGTTRFWSDKASPDPSFTPVLLGLAQDPSRAVRRFALSLLRRSTADAENVDTLRRALSADLEVAAAAAEALGDGRVREARDDLIAVLRDHGREPGWGHDALLASHLRRRAARALGGIGDPAAIDALVAALAHDPWLEVQAAAAWAIGEIGGERAITALIGQDHIDAVRVLGRLRVREAVPRIVGLLRARPAYRGACAEALARIGAPEAVGALAEVVTTSDDPLHRRAAMAAIARLDPDAAIDAALIATRDPDGFTRGWATVALSRCRRRDPRVVAWMAADLDECRRGDRLVLRALVARPEPEAARALLDLLKRTDGRLERRLAARALLAVAPLTEGIADRIEADLGTASDPVRHDLAWLLGELGARHAAPSLAQQLSHPTERVRAAAAAALAQLGPPDPALDQSDADEVDRRLAEAAADPSPRVRAKIVLAFGSRGREQDLPRVVAGLDDPHPGVRAAAAEAMRRSDRLRLRVGGAPPENG